MSDPARAPLLVMEGVCKRYGGVTALDGVDFACAPSFLDIAVADERVVSTNSFSKSWLMTGWRLGRW